jgi:hypothetical protein
MMNNTSSIKVRRSGSKKHTTTCRRVMHADPCVVMLVVFVFFSSLAIITESVCPPFYDHTFTGPNLFYQFAPSAGGLSTRALRFQGMQTSASLFAVRLALFDTNLAEIRINQSHFHVSSGFGDTGYAPWCAFRSLDGPGQQDCTHHFWARAAGPPSGAVDLVLDKITALGAIRVQEVNASAYVSNFTLLYSLDRLTYVTFPLVDDCSACAPGFRGAGCQVTHATCAAANCTSQGFCKVTTAGGPCLCNPGFTGANCSVSLRECGAQGTLQQTDGTCACNAGYDGKISTSASYVTRVVSPVYARYIWVSNADRTALALPNINLYTCPAGPCTTQTSYALVTPISIMDSRGRPCDPSAHAYCWSEPATTRWVRLEVYSRITAVESLVLRGASPGAPRSNYQFSRVFAGNTWASAVDVMGGDNCTASDHSTRPACETSSCSAVGACVEGSGCLCPQSYNGTDCADCVRTRDGWPWDTCIKCPDTYFGSFCEDDAAACSAARCNEQGDCVGELHGCICQAGNTGDDCSVTSETCSTNTCNDGGTCDEWVATETRCTTCHKAGKYLPLAGGQTSVFVFPTPVTTTRFRWIPAVPDVVTHTLTFFTCSACNVSQTEVLRVTTDKELVFAAPGGGQLAIQGFNVTGTDHYQTLEWWWSSPTWSGGAWLNTLTANNCSGCAQGTFGETCNTTLASGCNSRGTRMSDNRCICNWGYFGASCEFCDSNKRQDCSRCAHVDMYGPDCNLTLSECNAAVCNGNGTCTSQGPKICTCDSGVFGDTCHMDQDTCNTVRCSSSGICLSDHCQCEDTSGHLVRGSTQQTLAPYTRVLNERHTGRFWRIETYSCTQDTSHGRFALLRCNNDLCTSATTITFPPDHAFTADAFSGNGNPWCARLDKQPDSQSCLYGGWVASGCAHYVQIDMGQAVEVGAITFQAASLYSAYPVLEWQVSYSNDSTFWYVANQHMHCEFCRPGFYGTECTQSQTDCDATRCYGRGTCTGDIGGCLCENGYDPATDCLLCNDDGDPYTTCASCAINVYGDLCNETLAQCNTRRCLNRGTCVAAEESSGCDCFGTFGDGDMIGGPATSVQDEVLQILPANVTLRYMRFYPKTQVNGGGARLAVYACADALCATRIRVDTDLEDDKYTSTSYSENRFPWCARPEASDTCTATSWRPYSLVNGEYLQLVFPTTAVTVSAIGLLPDRNSLSYYQTYTILWSTDYYQWFSLWPKRCNVCAPGFYGSLCDQGQTFCNSHECGDKGTCTSVAGVCYCIDNVYGDKCDWTPGQCTVRRCYGKGVCQRAGCTCNTGWFGDYCALSSTQCNTQVCHGHGTCVMGDGPTTCVCSTGYEQKVNCLGCSVGSNITADPLCMVCYAGMFGLSCQQSQAACDVDRCNAQGTCTGINCACNGDYKPSTMCLENACGTGGLLGAPNSTCTCYDTHYYDAADVEYRCKLACSRGAFNHLTEICECPPAYHGIRCEFQGAMAPYQNKDTHGDETALVAGLVGSVIGLVFFTGVFIWCHKAYKGSKLVKLELFGYKPLSPNKT